MTTRSRKRVWGPKLPLCAGITVTLRSHGHSVKHHRTSLLKEEDEEEEEEEGG